MNTFRTFTFALFFVAVLALTSASAQQATRPAAGASASTPAATSGASSTNAIGIVNTAAFGDPKSGVTRLVNALAGVNREFQPRQTELQTLAQRLQAIADDVQKTQGVAQPAELDRKRQQAEQLQIELTRKREDAQRAYERRLGEVVTPIENDINTALTAFARQRNLSMVINVSQLPNAVLVLNDSMDLTRDFIAEYNRRNPATAAATTPPARR
ncbi:MAG: OmpH family outer membrane protein [Pyrinomonadaceae bacterium]|nr:OmpH family outer membrane protein [Pyrinomonadaceae bacterium]